MRIRSFGTRIALLSMLLSGLALAAFGALAWAFVYRVNLERVDREIFGRAQPQLGQPRPPEHWARLGGAIQMAFGESRQGAVTLLVIGRDGGVFFRSANWPVELSPRRFPVPSPTDPSLRPPPPGEPPPGGPPPGPPDEAFDHPPPPPPLPERPPEFSTRRIGLDRWRLGVMGNGEVTLVMGVRLDAFEADLRRMQNALLAALAVTLLLVGGCSWLFARRALRPVEALTRTVERVTAQGLGQRIGEEVQDAEFLRLVTVFNAMMDRLERSFNQAVRFSADAAHELKTPLAILQGELEEGLHEAPAGSERQRRYSGLLEEVLRLKSIVRQLLLLSLADAGQLRPHLVRHNLSVALGELVEDAEVLAPALEVSAEVAPGVHVPADPDLLTQVIRNLTSNAIKYNRAGGSVRFELREADGRVRLAVSNTGPGVPPEERDRIFDRFYRADPSRGRETDGLGLGLSLAREIARAHGGELVLEDSGADLTTFVLTLPAAPEPEAPPPG